MSPTKFATVFLLVAASVLPGCNSPTEPSTYYLRASGGSFGAADGSATILECHQILDSKEGSLFSFATPTVQVQPGVLVVDATHGHHTLVFRVTAQTQSPTTYRATGITVNLVEICLSSRGCPEVARVTLPDQTASLRTGEALTIGFDI